MPGLDFLHDPARFALATNKTQEPFNGCTIGKYCNIHHSAMLGINAFSYVLNNNGESIPIPQNKSVSIGNYVDIGAMAIICRGSWRDTLISDHVKIGNKTYIGHNVSIGPRTLIGVNVHVSGSTDIGSDVYIAPCACIKDYIKIGNKSIIGFGAVVIKDVPKGTTVIGNPAKELLHAK